MPDSASPGMQSTSALATSLHNLERELGSVRARLRELEVQLAAVGALSESLELAPTVRAFRDRLGALLPELSMAMVLYDPGDALRIPLADGPLASLVTDDDADDLPSWMKSLCRGAPTYLDAQAAEQLSSRLGGEPHVLFTVPLEPNEGQTLGLLILARPAHGDFAEEERKLLVTAGTHFASTLKKAMLFAQTKELSITDPLTRVHNRRYLQERLEQELSRAQRYSHPLSVLLIDIDHFKLFNDCNGHLQGDQLLRQLAAVLQRHTRQADLVARFGGEEFVIVLPEIDADDGRTVAEKLRLTVEQTPFEGEAALPSGQLTISVGVATFPADAQEAVQLLELADRGLYLAKQRGRNCVAHFLDEL